MRTPTFDLRGTEWRLCGVGRHEVSVVVGGEAADAEVTHLPTRTLRRHGVLVNAVAHARTLQLQLLLASNCDVTRENKHFHGIYFGIS